MPRDQVARLIKDLERRMKDAARDLEFEKAAALRDQVVDLRKAMVLDDDAQIAERGEKVGVTVTTKEPVVYRVNPTQRRSRRRAAAMNRPPRVMGRALSSGGRSFEAPSALGSG